MPNVHLANTDFEFELAYFQAASFQETWALFPVCLQLQYLPLLYADSEDVIVVTDLPDPLYMQQLARLCPWRQESWPTFQTLDTHQDFSKYVCKPWGFTPRVEQWANEHALQYKMPTWSIVQEINSKAFSFQHALYLKGAALLWKQTELENWMSTFAGKKVLKTCFGLSAKGNRLIDSNTSYASIHAFCEREWQYGRPLIGEPWLDRTFDFSTQWYIESSGTFSLLGTTVFETEPNGTYKGTLAGSEEKLFDKRLPFLSAHKQAATHMLQRLVQRGFFGHVGFDALLYRAKDQTEQLYPIVEINGRQTMSLVALKLQQRWFPTKIVRLSYVQTKDAHLSLLPINIKLNDYKNISFNKSLILSVI